MRTKLNPPESMSQTCLAKQQAAVQKTFCSLKSRSWRKYIHSSSSTSSFKSLAPFFHTQTETLIHRRIQISRIRIRYMCAHLYLKVVKLKQRQQKIQRQKDTSANNPTGYHVTSLRSIEWCLTYGAQRNRLNMGNISWTFSVYNEPIDIR